ncbi:alpha/beta hydrolase [Flavihumibacter sp. RY-1]|uniref:Alpha/beta hydrolase n=1 Tax=Flavihumibacter fluminis TaxID=2909236 RepID=A0ABS9BDM8_9BACT|nr:alpha/beta hydrolase [Flavihumibacter fluminis]MCF1713705.1 alpha/beta hydrolase [Flavihumibacter fluminis]
MNKRCQGPFWSCQLSWKAGVVGLLFCFVGNLVFGQGEIAIWPSRPPYSKDSDTLQETDVPGPLFTSKKNIRVPSITVFMPAEPNGTSILICPGGAYGFLAWDIEGTKVAEWLSKEGVTAFVLKYRLPDARYMEEPHKVPLIDALQAIRVIRYRAKEWKLDPQRIGIMGFSAGGHLAASVSTHYEDFDKGKYANSGKPDFAVLVYPVITTDSMGHPGSIRNLLGNKPSKQMHNYFSLDKQVTAMTPATILFHPLNDQTVPVEGSLRYFNALKANKVDAAMHILHDGGHDFGVAQQLGTGTYLRWKELLLDWMASQSLVSYH